MESTIEVDERRVATTEDEVRIRVYSPLAPVGAAGVVWCHGGAFAYGDIDMPESDWVCREFARAGRTAVSVDYSLCDPTPFETGEGPTTEAREVPVAAVQVRDCAREVLEGRIDGRVDGWFIGGASAGANLALAACRMLIDEGGPVPLGVLLAYPIVHAELPVASDEIRSACAKSAGPWPVFTDEMVRRMSLGHAGGASNFGAAYFFPGDGPLGGLPPLRIVNSEFDSLRASGELLAEQASAAGCAVEVDVEPGTEHGHLNTPDHPAAMRTMMRFLDWMDGIGDSSGDR